MSVDEVPYSTQRVRYEENNVVQVLMRAWSALEVSIQMSITRSGIERAVQNMDVPRHLEIVDAIATGDPAHAAATIERHMELAIQTLIS